MRKEILASIDPFEVRVAILEDGVLSGIMVERGVPLAGNIYKGRVASVLPGMEAAFVDIGLERNAFLPLADIRSERIGGGGLEDAVGRGPHPQRLRGRPGNLLPGTQKPRGATRAPALLYQDLGLVGRVVRDLFTGSVDRFVVDSPAELERIRSLLVSFPPELLERVSLHSGPRPLFEAHDVEREIERALHRKVWLRSGGYLVFDRTEAATVIDVNTGKYVGK